MTGTAVITGANSGIGNALARILIKEGYEVIAADKDIGITVQSLGCTYSLLDVTSPESIQSFRKEHGFIDEKKHLDLLLNVAGILPSEDSLESLTLSTLLQTFSVNTFGPILLTQALLPNLYASSSSSSTSGSSAPPCIAVVSSRVGSIADNSTGGSYAYRSSKAAVNALFKNLANDLAKSPNTGANNIVVSILHPGIVITNMTKELDVPEGAVEPEVAAEGLWRVLQEKGTERENSGRWWHRSGEELPW